MPIQKPLMIEVGPGRGDFLFHLARNNPEAVVFGIEIKPRRFQKLIDSVEAHGLKNICLIQADARDALRSAFDPESVKAIYVNFPDPWPKRRHAKNRVLDEPFVTACADVLAIGGELTIITDVEWYSDDLKKITGEIPTLRRENGDHAVYPTLFAKKWLAAGRNIFHNKWIKIDIF